jgi:cysteine desulfurase
MTARWKTLSSTAFPSYIMADKNIYLDHAATTPLHPGALEAMLPFLTDSFANPSSVYSGGRAIRRAIDAAREQIATAIGANAREIFFTAGGTEADNWAIQGMLHDNAHVITTATEHHGILFTCKALEKLSTSVTYLPVDACGFVSPTALNDAITPNTCVISIMHANNETGTIQPIAELSAIARQHRIPFHTDAVASVGHIPVNVDALGVDMLSLSAHKFGGPKGVGALYVRKGTKLSPMFHGGHQERNLRAGTENVAGIAGMAAALNIAMQERDAHHKYVSALRDRLIAEIAKIPHTRLNGPAGDMRLPGNVNASFEFIEGEALLLLLDMQGVSASTGSACSSGALDPSHVLMAMGLAHEQANGAIRFSLGATNTDTEITELTYILRGAVEKLRAMSPLYDDFLKRTE